MYPILNNFYLRELQGEGCGPLLSLRAIETEIHIIDAYPYIIPVRSLARRLISSVTLYSGRDPVHKFSGKDIRLIFERNSFIFPGETRMNITGDLIQKFNEFAPLFNNSPPVMDELLVPDGDFRKSSGLT